MFYARYFTVSFRDGAAYLIVVAVLWDQLPIYLARKENGIVGRLVPYAGFEPTTS